VSGPETGDGGPGPTERQTKSDPHQAEPPDDSFRQREEAAGGSGGTRDMTAALGTRGEPGSYRRAEEGAGVALHDPHWGDMRWSFLYERGDTRYRDAEVPGTAERVAAANRRARAGTDVPSGQQGPMMKPAVWTWEVPLYFWFGGIASGSAFVSLACDLSGDPRSAATARKVALAAVAPCPVLLVSDLGRPSRFLNMLRIFKPRSPMSMGAWCLFVFGNLSGLAVAADVLRLRTLARGIGAVNAGLGAYLGSYGGVLLGSTAVPVWARSKRYLGPIFAATATATGASAVRIVLVARGMGEEHPTRRALGRIETGAMAAELGLSTLLEHRLGRLAHAVEEGSAKRLFELAKYSVRGGLASRLLSGRRFGTRASHTASGLFLLGGLAFRYAWVHAGRASAHDDEAVALTARGKATRGDGAG
jgi:formate-dependent nitrite reductase membrane component NrfD